MEDNDANGDRKVAESEKHKIVVIGGRHAWGQDGQNYMQFIDKNGATCESCLANGDIFLPFAAYVLGSAYSDGLLVAFGGKPTSSGDFNGKIQNQPRLVA